MRVIRTEKYFDGNYLKRREDRSLKVGDISFAWIRMGDSPSTAIDRLPDLQRAVLIVPDQVPLVLDYILRRDRMQPFTEHKDAVLNPRVVEQILNEPIVIELSPPDVATLSHILKEGVKGGGTVALSVYVAVSGDVYLFVTLPLALLVIGASKGMSKWLEQNIPKLMNRVVRRWS
jgi:hypothetical protein